MKILFPVKKGLLFLKLVVQLLNQEKLQIIHHNLNHKSSHNQQILQLLKNNKRTVKPSFLFFMYCFVYFAGMPFQRIGSKMVNSKLMGLALSSPWLAPPPEFLPILQDLSVSVRVPMSLLAYITTTVKGVWS